MTAAEPRARDPGVLKRALREVVGVRSCQEECSVVSCKKQKKEKKCTKAGCKWKKKKEKCVAKK